MSQVAGIAKCSAAFGEMQFRAGLHVLTGAAFIMEMHLELFKNVLREKEALQFYRLSVNSPMEAPFLGYILEYSERFSFK